MTDEPKLRLKWTLRAHGKQVFFAKGRMESPENLLITGQEPAVQPQS